MDFERRDSWLSASRYWRILRVFRQSWAQLSRYSPGLVEDVGRFSRLLQTDVGIAPDRQLLFNLADPVPKSPEFAARRSDLDIEAALVGNLVWFVLHLECAEPSLGQSHVRAFS